MPHVACAYEFCDLKHESPVEGSTCVCSICRMGPLHHSDCCTDHFREQHRGIGECEPVIERRRGLFSRAARAAR
jgi:hypothetical protein